jgi:hypothetical protein
VLFSKLRRSVPIAKRRFACSHALLTHTYTYYVFIHSQSELLAILRHVYCPESGNTVDVLSVTQTLVHETNINDPTTTDVTETATHLAQRLHVLQTELHTLGQRESREQANNNNNSNNNTNSSSRSETSLTHKRRVQAMLVELHDVATRLHDVSPLIAPIDAGFLMQMYMNAPQQHTQRASLATRNGKQRQRSVQALLKSQKRKRKQVSVLRTYLRASEGNLPSTSLPDKVDTVDAGASSATCRRVYLVLAEVCMCMCQKS